MNLKKNFNKIENSILVIFVAIFFIFSFLIFFSNLISNQIFEIRLRSFFLLLLPLLSSILYLYDKNRESIPLFHIHLFYFSVPAGIFGLLGNKLQNLIFNNIDKFKMTNKLFIDSLDLILLYCLILLLIFLISKFFILNNSKNKFLKKNKSIKIFQGIFPFVVFLIFILIERKNFINEMNTILFPFGIYSSLVFYYLFLSSNKLIPRFMFILPIFIVLIHYIINWTLLNSIIILLSLVILEIKVKNKINYLLILLIFIIPLSLSKIKNEIRYLIKDNYIVSEYQNNNFQNKSLIERFEIIQKFINSRNKYSFDKQIDNIINELEIKESKGPFEYFPIEANLIKKNSFDFLLLRFTENNLNLSKMIFYSENDDKFANGETLVQILISFVPRIIWNEKPSMSFGNRFGKTFNILVEENNSTSINLNWINEFYWNFKLKGIIFGSISVGLFIICLNFITNKLNDHNYIIVLSSISMIMIPESNLSIYLSYLVKTFILLYVLSFLINKIFYKIR